MRERLALWVERKAWFLGRRFGFVPSPYGWKRGRWVVSRFGSMAYNEGGYWFTAYLGWRRGRRGFRVWFCPPRWAKHIGRWMSIGWIEHS